jgi:hypothetical protein
MSWVKKIFVTALVVGFDAFWYAEIVNDYLETVSIRCQPSPVQVMCQITNEPDLGGTNLKIPKTQLTEIEYRYRAMEGVAIQWISLTTISEAEIPLNRSRRGRIIQQLRPYKDRIAKFIADPQAQTLNIETHQRNMPFQVPIVTGFIILLECLYLRNLWRSSRSDKT